MAAIVERERTFAFRIERAMVSTIGIPEDPIVIDTVVGKKTMPNLNPRAVLLSIKTEEQKLHFAMYFKGSQDKEGYRQLVPFFHDAETPRFFDADVFISYPDGSRGIISDSRTASKAISAVPDFDFESAKLDFGFGNAVIALHSHNGVKTPEGSPPFKVEVVLKESKTEPVLEKRV